MGDSKNTTKILVADDSLTIQKVIRLALSNEGYDIQAVSDGNEATETIPLFRPHVVLIDVSLPKVSAFDIVKSANEDGTHQRTKFILMSSSYDEIDEDQLNQNHFDGRLTKPFDPAHLRSVIQEALDARENTAEIPAPKTPDLPKQAAPDLPPIPDQNLEESSTGEFHPPLGETKSLPTPPPFRMKHDFAEDVSNRSSEQETHPSIHIEGESTQASLSSDLWESASPGEIPPAIPEDSPPELPEASQSIQLDAPPPIPDEVASAAPPVKDDIKELTNETIKMTGMDQFDWAVEEHALKKDEPSIRLDQTQEIATGESVSQPTVVGDKTLVSLHIKEPGMPTPSNFESVDSTFELNEGEIPKPFDDLQGISDDDRVELQVDAPSPFQMPPSETPHHGVQTEEPSSVPLSKAQMQELIQEQLEATLQQMAKDMLPGLAEKIIKNEINKLLSNPPN